MSWDLFTSDTTHRTAAQLQKSEFTLMKEQGDPTGLLTVENYKKQVVGKKLSVTTTDKTSED